jgi:hypothetical protein
MTLKIAGCSWLLGLICMMVLLDAASGRFGVAHGHSQHNQRRRGGGGDYRQQQQQHHRASADDDDAQFMPKRLLDPRHGRECRYSVKDCGVGGRCVPPLFEVPAHCTSCRPQVFSDRCEDDASCDGDHICETERGTCDCQPKRVCVPGCTVEGHECADDTTRCDESTGRCVERTCSASEDCDLRTSRCEKGKCRRLSCFVDSDCAAAGEATETGACIDGICYLVPGQCYVPYHPNTIRQHRRCGKNKKKKKKKKKKRV